MEQASTAAQRVYLNLDQVAERWGVSRGTVYNAVSEDRLKAKRFGRHIRVHVDEVKRYEEESDWENGQYRVSPLKGKKMPKRPDKG